MTQSIDSYYRSLARLAAVRQSEASSTASTDKEETAAAAAAKGLSADKVEFSQSLTRFLSGTDSVEGTPTENYMPPARPPVSTEDMKSFLSSLEEKLGSLDTDSDSESTGSSISELLSGIREQLASYDADSATDEETAEVFDSVMQSLHSLMPPPPPPPGGPELEAADDATGSSDSTGSGSGGLPPMLAAMGAWMPPPFAMEESEESTGIGSSSSSTLDLSSLSSEDKSKLLASLQAKLAGWDSSASEDTANSLLSQILEELSAASL